MRVIAERCRVLLKGTAAAPFVIVMVAGVAAGIGDIRVEPDTVGMGLVEARKGLKVGRCTAQRRQVGAVVREAEVLVLPGVHSNRSSCPNLYDLKD